HVVGAAAQFDVVFLGAGEIEQCRPEAIFVEQANVDLKPVVEVEADLVFAFGENLIDPRIGQDVRRDRIDVFLRGEAVGKCEQQIEIANRFAAATQGAGGDDPFNPLGVFVDVLDDLGGGVFRGVEPESTGRAFVGLDCLQNVLFALFAKPRQIAEFAFLGELLNIGDGSRLKIGPEKRDFLWAQGLQIQNVEQRYRKFLQELLPEAVVARFEDFLDVFDHAIADAGEFFGLSRLLGKLLDRFVHSSDEFRSLFVGSIAADDRAVDFQQ